MRWISNRGSRLPRRTVEGTVSQGLVGYYKSNFFTGLAISSQKMRRAELERFRNDHGDKRVVLMHSTAIQNILNGKTPAAQRNFRKALRGFIDHCLSVKLMRVDPLAGAKFSKMKTIGHHPWEMAECEQFEAHHADRDARAAGLRAAAAGRAIEV